MIPVVHPAADNQIAALEQSVDYKFNNQSLLIEALSHPSLKQHTTAKGKYKDYERLELLGDSILNFVITEILFTNYLDFPEGKLAKVRAYLVCRDTICLVANKIDLANYMIMTSGEETGGGRNNANNVENTMEALIAAIYLDSNIETIKKIIKTLWGDLLLNFDLTTMDSKTSLQEWAQSQGNYSPHYNLVKKTGPSHSPWFTIKVTVHDYEEFGEGSSLKTAEKEAAKKLLAAIRLKENL